MDKYSEVCCWLESILPSASKLETEWWQVLFIGTLPNSGELLEELLGSCNDTPASVNPVWSEGAMQWV